MRAAGWAFRLSLLVPFAYLSYRLFVAEDIGADPAKYLIHKMGQFALYYLALNLVIGALISYSFRFPKALRFLPANRRWLGVVTFVYLIFHLLLYLVLEGFEAQAFTQVFDKLYLFLGLCAFSIMFVLALTSNGFAVRKLGFKKWKYLHRSVYLATAIITVHVMLIEKADLIFYGIFFMLLWLMQLPRVFRRSSPPNLRP